MGINEFDKDKLIRNRQYYKFCLYGFLKNLRFFEIFMFLFLAEKGLPYTQIGLLYAVREIFINIFEIPSGFVADSYGRRNSLIASFFIYILSFILFYIANKFWLLMSGFILFGVADAFRSGTHKGMIMDYLKLNHREHQIKNYYGHTRSWSQNGSAVSALISGLLVFYGGHYQFIFLYSIIPYLLNLILIASYPKALNRTVKLDQSGIISDMKETIRTFRFIIKQARVLKIINTSAVHTAFMTAGKDYIQPLMVNVALLVPLFASHSAEQKNGIIIGVIYFIIYVLTSRASALSSSIEKKSGKNIPHLTLLAGFSFGALFGILYIFEEWIIGLVAFAAIFLLENIRKPILTGYVAENVPTSILTSVISAQSLLKTIITATIALVLGIFADHFGIGKSFVLISLFLILTSIFINNFTKKTITALKH